MRFDNGGGDHCPSLVALKNLPIQSGSSRRRQLGMVFQEIAAALEDGVLPTRARRDLRYLLDDAVLWDYVRVAETGALRSRLVNGGKPPTASATNSARLDCLDLIRDAAGFPSMPRDRSAPVELRPTPGKGDLAALRHRLDDDLRRIQSPGHARFIAVLAVVLDTRARTGELVTQRLADLTDDHSHIRVVRRPQRGTAFESVDEMVSLSPLCREALAHWLPVRATLTEPLQGSATALWVSLTHNHAGAAGDDGRHTHRVPGMPLQQSGLIRSYNRGRHQYGLVHLLPPKLEQLRRALEEISCPGRAVTRETGSHRHRARAS
ncbi:hypothetical protein QZH56_01505 [Streptomyces olivoreticuli]|uniref:hypothetical protein n=1 Tax=Streptomyces olivoreticuli TaxID=68246 RepID=UPI0026588756|nr:hypothetical protein [Streptomyces olivoreticuli]WKK27788.1 hypothetical protein QZH56_01505 [Streptomyces olivoreticuli]